MACVEIDVAVDPLAVFPASPGDERRPDEGDLGGEDKGLLKGCLSEGPREITLLEEFQIVIAGSEMVYSLFEPVYSADAQVGLHGVEAARGGRRPEKGVAELGRETLCRPQQR